MLAAASSQPLHVALQLAPDLLHDADTTVPAVAHLLERVVDVAFSSSSSSSSSPSSCITSITRVISSHALPHPQSLEHLVNAVATLPAELAVELLPLTSSLYSGTSAEARVLLTAYSEAIATDRDLTVPVLGCLADVNLPEEQAKQVYVMARAALRVVDEDDYPAVARAVLNAASRRQVQDAFRALRRTSSNLSASALLLLINVMSNATRVDDRVGRAFLHCLAQSPSLSGALDLTLLLSFFHNTHGLEKRAWRVFVAALAQGALNVHTFNAFFPRSPALQPLTPSLVRVVALSLTTPDVPRWLPEYLVPAVFAHFASSHAELLRLLARGCTATDYATPREARQHAAARLKHRVARMYGLLAESAAPAPSANLPPAADSSSRILDSLARAHPHAVAAHAHLFVEITCPPRDDMHELVVERILRVLAALAPHKPALEDSLLIFTRKSTFTPGAAAKRAGIILSRELFRVHPLDRVLAWNVQLFSRACDAIRAASSSPRARLSRTDASECLGIAQLCLDFLTVAQPQPAAPVLQLVRSLSLVSVDAPQLDASKAIAALQRGQQDPEAHTLERAWLLGSLCRCLDAIVRSSAAATDPLVPAIEHALSTHPVAPSNPEEYLVTAVMVGNLFHDQREDVDRTLLFLSLASHTDERAHFRFPQVPRKALAHALGHLVLATQDDAFIFTSAATDGAQLGGSTWRLPKETHAYLEQHGRVLAHLSSRVSNASYDMLEFLSNTAQPAAAAASSSAAAAAVSSLDVPPLYLLAAQLRPYVLLCTELRRMVAHRKGQRRRQPVPLVAADHRHRPADLEAVWQQASHNVVHLLRVIQHSIEIAHSHKHQHPDALLSCVAALDSPSADPSTHLANTYALLEAAFLECQEALGAWTALNACAALTHGLNKARAVGLLAWRGLALVYPKSLPVQEGDELCLPLSYVTPGSFLALSERGGLGLSAVARAFSSTQRKLQQFVSLGRSQFDGTTSHLTRSLFWSALLLSSQYHTFDALWILTRAVTALPGSSNVVHPRMPSLTRDSLPLFVRLLLPSMLLWLARVPVHGAAANHFDHPFLGVQRALAATAQLLECISGPRLESGDSEDSSAHTAPSRKKRKKPPRDAPPHPLSPNALPSRLERNLLVGALDTSVAACDVLKARLDSIVAEATTPAPSAEWHTDRRVELCATLAHARDFLQACVRLVSACKVSSSSMTQLARAPALTLAVEGIKDAMGDLVSTYHLELPSPAPDLSTDVDMDDHDTLFTSLDTELDDTNPTPSDDDEPDPPDDAEDSFSDSDDADSNEDDADDADDDDPLARF